MCILSKLLRNQRSISMQLEFGTCITRLNHFLEMTSYSKRNNMFMIVFMQLCNTYYIPNYCHVCTPTNMKNTFSSECIQVKCLLSVYDSFHTIYKANHAIIMLQYNEKTNKIHVVTVEISISYIYGKSICNKSISNCVLCGCVCMKVRVVNILLGFNLIIYLIITITDSHSRADTKYIL